MKALWVINVLILQVWKQAAPSPLPRFPPKKDADASSLPEMRLLCGVRIKENWVKISWDNLRNRFNTSLLQSDFINGISICAKGAVRGEDHSGSAHLWRWRRSSMETDYIGVYAPAKLLESDESPVSFTNVAALTLLMLVLLKSHTSKTCRRKMEDSMESCSRLFSLCFNQIFV